MDPRRNFNLTDRSGYFFSLAVSCIPAVSIVNVERYTQRHLVFFHVFTPDRAGWDVHISPRKIIHPMKSVCGGPLVQPDPDLPADLFALHKLPQLSRRIISGEMSIELLTPVLSLRPGGRVVQVQVRPAGCRPGQLPPRILVGRYQAL